MTAELKVLECPGCKAPVPLTDGEGAACPHCGGDVRFPPAYVALRRANALDKASRAEAERLFSTLSKPAPLAARVAAAIVDQPMIGFWFFFGAPVGIAGILAGLALDGVAARVLGYPSADDVPFAFTLGAIFAAIFLLAFVPRAFGIFANRRATARRVLSEGLACRPPAMPGGPSRCRECDAPIDLPDGALVARCPYCGADNAARIRAGQLLGAATAAASVAHTVVEAAGIDREERGATARTLFKELARYLVTTGVFAGLFIAYAIDSDRAAAHGEQLGGAGFAAMLAAVILFIVLIIRSIAGKEQRAEARGRREGTGVPGWVRFVGPIALWLVVFPLLRLLSGLLS
jgi:DNA-directed RNA polymerase subunit RPC12/RpoP